MWQTMILVVDVRGRVYWESAEWSQVVITVWRL